MTINLSAEEKLTELKKSISSFGSVLIAFSAGVDSSFLVKVVRDTLGRDKTLAVTGDSPSIPRREISEAIEFAKKFDIEHVIVETAEMDSTEYTNNSSDRCYYCKSELFSTLGAIAKERGIEVVADGSNVDDLDDHRPGARAAGERCVISPLQEAGLTKDEIRQLSQSMDLPTWDKPEMACLASRIPNGNPVSEKNLKMVEQAEEFLRDMGFSQIRVRHHGDMARLEFSPHETAKAAESLTAHIIDNGLKKIGFSRVTLDLAGYHRGGRVARPQRHLRGGRGAE